MSNPPNYKELRAIWYDKLKADGFSDIESDDNNLKVWSSKLARKNPPDIWQAKAAYYNMCDKFLNDYKFATQLESTIWEYHSNAISIRDITATLNQLGVIKTNRDAIWNVIHRLETIMKKLYMPGAAYE